MPATSTPAKPATLPAIAVGLVLFDIAPNTSYRAAARGELVTGLPAIRAGGRSWQVATARVEDVIGRPLTADDLDAIDRVEQSLAERRRERVATDVA